MTREAVLYKRGQTIGEEIANSVSHGIGTLAAAAGVPVLIMAALQHGGVASVVGMSLFAASLLLLYLSSTLYHALPPNRAKQIFQMFDHIAIFLLIAGTYTPFTLGVLRGAWGWTLFGLVWGLALVGIIFKILTGVRYPALSTTLYLGMGWLVIIAIKPLLQNMPVWGLFWLAAGGLAYSVGVLFYVLDDRVRYSHFIWHLFVLAGSSCHFIAVLRYST